MDAATIGKLQRVALREVWKHEAHDFTQWLQENIDVLNDALELTLVNVDREQDTGSFSIDLVAEDEGGGTVIIENQLEKSNHDHLGKLITYLTGMSLYPQGAMLFPFTISDIGSCRAGAKIASGLHSPLKCIQRYAAEKRG